MTADINKFSFHQMTSNSDGKTSGSGTAGLSITVVGSLSFMIGVFANFFSDKGTEIMMQSIVLITLGTGLLGYRKSRDGKVQEEQ